MTDIRPRGSLPFPALRAGADSLPTIEHIVVCMKENHSFDNYFGMLGSGDGFTLGPDGRPINSNPDAAGHPVLAHHATSPFNPLSGLSQTWNSSHRQWHGGAMDGFVTTSDSDAPMAYFDESDLPFYYGLARTFGIADRYFSSCLAQTFPNRRFLQAATADGLVSTTLPGPFVQPPSTGLIWDRLDDHAISWADYFVEAPEVGLWPPNLLTYHEHLHDIGDYFSACSDGSLPSVSFVTPEFLVSTEGEFQDNQIGEAFTEKVISAAMASPLWPKMMFVLCWDEGGGYYDHVAPPPAVAPDDVPPDIQVPPDEPGGYDQYGFRVPGLVISPYTKPGHVSSVVYDHTSILATIEYKWNLPALTRRDANATPLLDFLDLAGPPAFLTPPQLPPPAINP